MNRSIFSTLLFSLVALCGATLPAAAEENAVREVKQCVGSNVPIGEPKGIHPGQVAWIHAPGLVSLNENPSDWIHEASIDQKRCDAMMSALLTALTGIQDEREAWLALVASHNNGRPYRTGEKITVKINNNNTESHADAPDVNASPQMVLSLVRSMVQSGAFRQEDIAIAEPSRFITDAVYNPIHAEFPKVTFVDNQGGDGRVKVEFKPEIMHYSADNGQLARGIATCFTDADYVINMALLKGHVGQGVTLCAKNWYGCMSLHADWRKNFHDNFDQDRSGRPKYLTFVDFMGHRDLGGKCILYLVDGLVGCRNVGGVPGPKWEMEPFNGDWPCTLLGSQDPVAIDAVGLDLLSAEFPDAPDMDFSDMYLLEAASPNPKPSHTEYDPEGDGSTIGSLGLLEHWNNPTDHRYTRLDLHYITR